MKLWISKSSEVPIQEQLTTQFILGIVSADFSAGERLPSTTQLARRFQIHANTVRAAYRNLVERGWAEWRAGSGFYVQTMNAQEKLNASLDLDQMISTFLDVARTRGYSLRDIQTRISRWFSVQSPDHIAVIEPDPELREILISEIGDKISMPVAGISVKESAIPKNLVGAFCVALYDHAKEVRSVLPSEVSCLMLRPRSIAKSLAGERRPEAETVISVISRWPDFLHWARTALVAVGLDPNALDIRDARQKSWNRGLTGRSFIITDSLLARHLPDGCRPRVFRVISDESIAELSSQVPLHDAEKKHKKTIRH